MDKVVVILNSQNVRQTKHSSNPEVIGLDGQGTWLETGRRKLLIGL